MSATPEPEPPSGEEEPTVGDNVRFIDGGGDLRVEDGTLVAPEFMGSEYGWTRLQHAYFSPSSGSKAAQASLTYGETRTVRLTYSDSSHVVTVDIEFDEQRDGQIWQRAAREAYDDFDVALERYIEVIKEGLVDTSLMKTDS